MFYAKLYTSPKLNKKKKKIVKKIKNGKLTPNIYVVTLSNGNNLMEFYPSYQLLQPYYKEHMPYIIGLADGYGESLDLICRILNDCFSKTGDYNIKKMCLGDSSL